MDHNKKLQDKMIDRLLDKPNFTGACYEARVLAKFILAGFDIELKDEGYGQASDVEFVAIHKSTKRRFAVEAKARQPGKKHAGISRQLRNAFKKPAIDERVIFIDLNHPENASDPEQAKWPKEVVAYIRQAENDMMLKGKPAPPAYIFITNFPYAYHMDSTDVSHAVLAEGFKIADFGGDVRFSSIRAAVDARERHQEMFELIESMKTHNQIPVTFDGEVPEITFGNAERRFKIGETYMLDSPTGEGDIAGKLTDAIVNESDGVAHCSFYLEDGSACTLPAHLSDAELKAYRQHPDTFFGVSRPVPAEMKGPVDLYDFFHSSYKDTPKERLLELMSNHADKDALTALDQEELANRYSESLANAVIARADSNS